MAIDACRVVAYASKTAIATTWSLPYACPPVVRVRFRLPFSQNQNLCSPNMTFSFHMCVPTGDPDMDTMPVLAWSVQMARSAHSSTTGRFMIANQV